MRKFKEYIEITVGVFLVSLALQIFFIPQNLVIGGVSGLAIIIEYVSGNLGFPIPVYVTNFVFNLPMLLLSFKLMGRDILIKSIYTILMMTFFLAVLEYLPISIYSDMLLSSIFGGVVIGAGTALIIRRGATSGGTTLAAVLLRKIFKGVRTTKLILFLDVTIILLGFVLFGPINTMYAIIAIFITIKTTDIVVTGFEYEKAMFIISDKHKEVGEALLANVYRGMTALPSRGVYTGQERDMLLVVMNQRQMVVAKEIIKEVDPKAFVIVATVSEVVGEGFRPFEDTSSIV